MNKQEFFSQLERHDWTYMYSDNHRAYTRGRDNMQRLQEVASQSPELKQLLDNYSRWFWNHVDGDKSLEKPTV